MKFKIKDKLLVLATLPILTILLFSANHIKDKYFELNSHEKYLKYSELIQKSGNILHELQMERGLSSSFLNDSNSSYFLTELSKQKIQTNYALDAFKQYNSSLDKTILSSTSINFLNKVDKQILQFMQIRDNIKNKEISSEESFQFITNLNKDILSLTSSLKIYSNDEQIYNEILALKQLLILQESAGQERAHLATLVQKFNISAEDLQKFQTLVAEQQQQRESIAMLLTDSITDKDFTAIHHKYLKTYFNTVRQELEKYKTKECITRKIYKTIGFGGMIYNITQYQRSQKSDFYNTYLSKKHELDILTQEYINHVDYNTAQYKAILNLQDILTEIGQYPTNPIDEIKILALYKILEQHAISLDAVQWFEISTNRINEIHQLETQLIMSINETIQKNQTKLQTSLIYQIFLTFGTIVFLLLGAQLISKNINKSIKNLSQGIKEFFNFLNFEQENANLISTNSNDELNDIAQEINNQIKITQDNLEHDKDFINETTQIVTLMKDGNFSERVYYNPKNPNLIELKIVLDELIELIAQKIKEQTASLETLNASLEDKVFLQTIELQSKIKELTLARDEAIRAEMAKDEFLANMSHEIRTPLNAILGFVAILKRNNKDEKSEKYLTIIDTSGKSLLTIINDILDFSKIQSGKFTITTHPIDPMEEFSNAALLFASKAYEKHLIYAVYIDPALPKTISADAVRIKQIFSNLLSNAIKFTPEDGEIKVKVICKDNKLIVSVQDNGIGISEENRSKVFSAFEQADGSTTRKYGGTGLGLSISLKLALLMKGTLTLKSEEGKGSVFTLSIPIEIIEPKPKEFLDLSKMSNLTFALLGNCIGCATYTKLIKQYLIGFGITNIISIDTYRENGYDILFFVPDDDYNEDIVHSTIPAIALLRSEAVQLASLEHIKPLYAPFLPKSIIHLINDMNIKNITILNSYKAQEAKNLQLKYKGKILVAEDNTTNQLLISVILEDYGIEYTIANNGIEAVEIFKKNTFNMVLMDENMPLLNGIGAMKQIKEFEKENLIKHTPIIVFTASVLESDKEMFVREGMDGFVGKPIEKSELESEFEKYLIKIV